MIIIAGNHDSASRLEAPAPLLELSDITVVGTLKRNSGEIDYKKMVVAIHSLANPDETVCCLAIPYLRDSDLPQEETYSKKVRAFFGNVLDAAEAQYGKDVPKVALAHLYATGSKIAEGSSERIVVGGSEQVDFNNISPEITYMALGHIHRRQRVSGCNSIRYCGSALPMSFTERSYRHGADILCINRDRSFTLESKDFTLLHPLLSFPEKALPWKDVETRINELPDEDDDGTPRCYLQLNVLLQDIDPSLSDKAEKALANKKVWLCKIQASYPASAEADPVGIGPIGTLQQLSPLDMIKKIYKARMNQDLPDNLMPLVKQVIKEAKNKELENE